MVKNIGVMRVFRRALLSRKNCHFYFNAKKSHFRNNAFQMWFERATIWILLADHAPYGDDSDYIPCAIKSTRNSWIFSGCFFFIAQIGKNSADSYASNKDENAQKSYQILPYSIQNIAIGIRTAKHIRYSVDFFAYVPTERLGVSFQNVCYLCCKKSTHIRRIRSVLGQTVEKQHDPWLFLWGIPSRLQKRDWRKSPC